jgi:predicted nuclease of predicted toxin-antitoxin system
MTFWLDAQLDPELADWLGATFKVVAKSTKEVGLGSASDEQLFQAARRFQDIAIVTKD